MAEDCGKWRASSVGHLAAVLTAQLASGSSHHIKETAADKKSEHIHRPPHTVSDSPATGAMQRRSRSGAKEITDTEAFVRTLTKFTT